MKPALIIGSTCVDIIINLDHLPKTEEDIHPSSQSMALGGCAFNTAYIVRLTGAPYTFISPVGSGMYGDYVAKHMAEAGIPITVRVPEKENGCCYCLVEATGERTFLSCHGVEYTFKKEWMESFCPEDFGLTYICGLEIEEPTGINIIEYLEEHPNLQVFYAPGPRVLSVGEEKNRRILALHPILHINEQESLALSGKSSVEEAAEHLHALTGNAVIITLGSRGTYCIDKSGKTFLAPSVPAGHVVDTIGAGDSHAGAVIACLTMDMTLFDAVSYANLVAAAIVGVKGICISRDQLPKLH